MNITINALEGTLMVAAGIIPLILILGSVEKMITLIDEYRYKRRLQKQLKIMRNNFNREIETAA